MATLEDFPIFNAASTRTRGEILFKKYYNIGIAVDTPEGLIVPVVKNADRKDMVMLAARGRRPRSAGAGAPARPRRDPRRHLHHHQHRSPRRRLRHADHQPARARDRRPAQDPGAAGGGDGEIVIRHMMYLSVSFDHRWIDGAEAAPFHDRRCRLVSNPNLLMARL